ncbi:terminase [Paraburkholderia atlantica]|uniref:terminase small subunit-like protein n=1 Tax=Paraburkholderia atlantica TaxID=2654982 RepID=UPI003D1991DF
MKLPPSYTPELAAEICERISSGETLRAICRDAHMPSWVTVYEWRKLSPEFSARLAAARELGADAIAEQALDIADTTKIGQRTEESEDGFKTVREDMLGHRKLQIETRLKLLAVWFPRKYGQRIDMTTGGESMNLTPEQRAEKLAALAAAAARRKATEDDGADLL